MDRLFEQAFGPELSLLAVEEKQQLLSRLLARLAHEIRNPLSSLDVHAQLLEEDIGGLDPVLRERLMSRLEIIQGELRRLENLVKHFLRLSAPSDLQLEPVNLAGIVQHVCDLLRPQAEERGIEIALVAVAPVPSLMADGAQLTQALLNLVINALQAVQAQGRIEVRLEQQNGCVVIGVADTGPGVSAGDLPSIFEPYYTTKPEGSGLGLWIVQQIASAHRGTIQVANGPAGGAVFTLRLPLDAQRPASSAEFRPPNG